MGIITYLAAVVIAMLAYQGGFNLILAAFIGIASVFIINMVIAVIISLASGH